MISRADLILNGKSTQVFVCSKKEMSSLGGFFTAAKCLFISNHTGPYTHVEHPSFINEFAETFFDDVEEGDPNGMPINHGIAMCIAGFLLQDCDCSNIFICCDGGVSRSAGVAAGFVSALGGDDSIFFKERCPNMTCYKEIRQAVLDTI